MSDDLSLKLKRGELSEVLGEDGPALDTVLEGPLLYQGGFSERGRMESEVTEEGRTCCGMYESTAAWLFPMVSNMAESSFVALSWDFPQISEMDDRNSFTCFRESELWSVSRG